MIKKSIDEGTPADLHKLLQAACDLELWTLPLYLTTLGSIQEDLSRIAMPPAVGGHTTVTRLLVSVAIQEMFHLQLAGNLARMFGQVPELNWPVYHGNHIPYITGRFPDVRLGTACQEHVLCLMLAVETPAPKTPDGAQLPGAPDVPRFGYIQYDDAGRPAYPSIGDLYSVLLQLAERFRGEMDPGAPQIANGLFSSWYDHTGLINPSTFDDAVDIIVSQGEGAIGKQAAPIPDGDALPSNQGVADPFSAENHLSHWERFDLVINNDGSGVTCWPTDSTGAGESQQVLSVLFQALLDGLRQGWSGNKPDLKVMFLLRAALMQVYQRGEIPTFATVDGSVSLDDALRAVAPEKGACWASQIRWFFSLTDIAGMEANGIHRTDLGSKDSVRSSQAAIVAVTQGQQMPPGELNRWSAAQILSFKSWDGT